jgi:hypothetical protein
LKRKTITVATGNQSRGSPSRLVMTSAARCLKNFGLEIEQHDQPLIRQWFKHQLAIGVAIDEASSYVVIDGSGHRIRAELFMRPRLRAIVG